MKTTLNEKAAAQQPAHQAVVDNKRSFCFLTLAVVATIAFLVDYNLEYSKAQFGLCFNDHSDSPPVSGLIVNGHSALIWAFVALAQDDWCKYVYMFTSSFNAGVMLYGFIMYKDHVQHAMEPQCAVYTVYNVVIAVLLVVQPAYLLYSLAMWFFVGRRGPKVNAVQV